MGSQSRYETGPCFQYINMCWFDSGAWQTVIFIDIQFSSTIHLILSKINGTSHQRTTDNPG